MYDKRQIKRKTNKTNNRAGKLNVDSRQFPRVTSLMPKEISSSPIIQFKRRYIAGAAIIFSLSITNILDSTITAVTAVLGYSPWRAIRIKKIRVWAPVETQGTAVSVSLTPIAVDTAINSFSDVPKTITDSSISFDRPAFIEYRPDEDHPSGSWHSATAVTINLVDFAIPKGAIIDIDYEAIMNLLYAPIGYTAVLVGATVGRVYVRGFSGCIPVGVTSI